jgi:DNA-binding PadR family transcriptional regulator
MALSKRALDGNVETFLLSILKEGPNYGYGLVQALNERAPGLVDFGEGTVYPVLHRMEAKGLLETSWSEAQSGRRRKYYRISNKGHGVLSRNLEEWRSLISVMERITGQSTHALSL